MKGIVETTKQRPMISATELVDGLRDIVVSSIELETSREELETTLPDTFLLIFCVKCRSSTS